MADGVLKKGVDSGALTFILPTPLAHQMSLLSFGHNHQLLCIRAMISI
ncbi:hypothetical protein [Thiolapillus sp.]